MIVSKKSHKNISEYMHFLFRKIFKLNKIGIISRNFENFMRKIESFQGEGLQKRIKLFINSSILMKFGINV